MKWLLGFLVAAGAAGVIVLYAGWYDISATDQHLAPTYWLLDTGMRQSIRHRAENLEVPDLEDARKIEAGAFLYRQHCVQCHGAPGIAPEPFALGMTPLPVPLVHTARTWPPAEMFWVIREGIKMTGMPAWKYRMTDEEIWSLVAYLPFMAHQSPAEFLAHDPAAPPPSTKEALEPDAERGRRALQQYACVGCHKIPGEVGPNAPVGPPLQGIASRLMLGGVLPNTPENMVRWLRDPPRFAPDTAMPALGVTERDALDMAAYLATLK